MVRRIAHRDLRNDSAEVLRSVELGETLEVTNHGRVVAVLSPSSGSALGTVGHRPPLKDGPFSALPRVRASESTADALDDLRSER